MILGEVLAAGGHGLPHGFEALAGAATAAAVLGAAHARGVRRLRRRARGRTVVPARRSVAWWGGLVVVGAAVAPPLHALAERSASAHMVQHLLLMVVAPLLLVAARPGLALAWSLPEPSRRRLSGLPAVPRAAAAVLPVAWALHTAVLAAWHVPAAYEAALAHPGVHLLEHASMLSAGWLLWAAVGAGSAGGRRRRGAAVLTVAAAGIAGGAIGVLLTFAGRVVYPSYAATPPGWPLSPLEDQQLAGLLMWVVAGAAYVLAGCLLFAAWLRGLERSLRRRAGAVGSAAGWVLVLVVGAACTRGTPTSPAAEEIERGRRLVAEYGCVTCHAVPGIAAPAGAVGPPLAGFARRRSVAGVLPNTADNVARWVLDPQAIQPGNLMPDVGLDEEQARAVAAFLATLD